MAGRNILCIKRIGCQVAQTRSADGFIRNTGTALAGDLTPEEIEALFDEGRAENLAITEVTRAATQGMEDAAALVTVTGVLLGHAVWYTADDSKVCPTCRPLDGRDRDYWSQFVFAGPPAHPRCQCYLLYS